MNILRRFIRPLIYVVAAAICIIVIPPNANPYMQTVINSVFIYFIAVSGITIMLGLGGQVSFATAAFIGMGGFLSTYMSMKMNIPTLFSAILAILLTGCFAVLIGSVINRMATKFVGFATIALNQILWQVYQNWRGFSGGPDGTNGIADIGIGSLVLLKGMKQYFVALVVIAVLCLLFVDRVRTTSLGRSLSSVRDNEMAAKTLGVNVYFTKIIAFTIAAMLAALAGVLITHQTHYISASTFTFDASTSYVIMAMLGGITSAPGAFVGVLLLTMLPEWLRPIKDAIRLVYGLTVILLMVFMPMGLAGLLANLTAKARGLMRKVGKKG